MARFRTMEQAMIKFQEEIFKAQQRSLSGLIAVGRNIKTTMDTVPPLIPVDTGNMRKSFYIVSHTGSISNGRAPQFSNKNKDAEMLERRHDATLTYAKKLAETYGKLSGPSIVLGVSAYYARYVHEMYGKTSTGKSINWTRENSGPGFFASAVSQNIKSMKKVIADHVKGKK